MTKQEAGKQEGALIHDTLRQARVEQVIGQLEAEMTEHRRGFDAFATEHGREPTCLERMRIRKEAAGEDLPDDWEERMMEGALALQAREDAGESLTEILESTRG